MPACRHGVADPLGYGLVIAAITYLSVDHRRARAEAPGPARTPRASPAWSRRLMRIMSRVARRRSGCSTPRRGWSSACSARRRRSASAVTEEEIRTHRRGGRDRRRHRDRRAQDDLRRAAARRPRRARRHDARAPRSSGSTSTTTPRRSARRCCTTTHSRLPVGEGNPDNMLGVVQVRELLAPLLSGKRDRHARLHAPRPGRARHARRARRAQRPARGARCRWRSSTTSTAISKGS